MSEVQWIKIATQIFDNRKIKQIEKLPEGDAIIVVWFKLLCLAGTCNKSGMVFLTDEIPFTDEMLATEFRMEEKQRFNILKLALATFERLKMIEIIDNIYFISSWDKYQNTVALEKIREQTRNRVNKHRAMKSLECNDDVTLQVTLRNATDKDIDKELDIDIEKDINKKHMCAFEELWNVYPRKKEKAKAYKCYQARMKDGYSPEDLLIATQNYATECSRQKTDEKYIKLAATFLGINTPFLDYVKESNNGQSRSNAPKNNELDAARAFTERFGDSEDSELPFMQR